MNMIPEQMLERPLPNSSEAERAILGAIILDNALVSQAIEQLKPEDFYVPSHRRIFLAMIALFEHGSEINPILIAEELRHDGAIESVGGVSFISNLHHGLPHFNNIAHYAKIVRDKSMLRQLVKVCNKVTSEALEEEDEAEVIYSRAEQSFRGVADSYPELFTENVTTIQELPELSSIALHGLAGDFVRTIEPHTEADPAALLVQFLIAFGSCIGRNPHFNVEADKHYTNLFANIVGATSSGRKGTSWSHIRHCFEMADEDWARDRVEHGLSSGEGLMTLVGDQGVLDKRLLVQESEFARVLRAQGREGNTLSTVVRQAWDTGNLRSLVKNNPIRATDAHISIIGHITNEELQRSLSEVERFNGYVNRFLWIYSRRSKLLAEGGNARQENYTTLIHRLNNSIQFARRTSEMRRSEDARAMWRKIYPDLTTRPSGLFGAVTARAAPQVVRLSLIYALLDESSLIQSIHLEAALALWKYSEDSVRYVFGERTGDKIADKILHALRAAASDGLSRTGINNIFRGHRKRQELDHALSTLLESGLARRKTETTSGRSAEYWFATTYAAEEAEKAEEAIRGDTSSAFSASSAGYEQHQADGRLFDAQGHEYNF